MDFGTLEPRKITILLQTFEKNTGIAGPEIYQIFGVHFCLIFEPFSHKCSMLFRYGFLDTFLDVIFLIFCRKWSQNNSPKGGGLSDRNRPWVAPNAPKTLQKRICATTSIFHGFCTDLGSHFDGIIMFFGLILAYFFAGSPFSPLPKYRTTNPDSPVSPRGAAVNAPRLQSAAPFGARRYEIVF